MTNYEACITTHMILYKSDDTYTYDEDHKKCGYKRYTLSITPVSVKTLQGDTIYKVKDGATLHRLNTRKLSSTFILSLKRNPDNYLVSDTMESLSYFTKDDLEPYVLSEYDKQRLAEHNTKVNKKQIFESLILPQIEALVNEDYIKDVYDFDKGYLRLRAHCMVEHDGSFHKLQNLLYEQLKAMNVVARRKYYGDIEILLTDTLNKLLPD